MVLENTTVPEKYVRANRAFKIACLSIRKHCKNYDINNLFKLFTLEIKNSRARFSQVGLASEIEISIMMPEFV